jgi:hemin uptake protein HemP
VTHAPNHGEEPQQQKNDEEPAPQSPIIRTQELLRGHRELRIVHGDEIYRLLLTRNNKLILQK